MSLPNMASRRFNVTVIGYRGWTGSMLSAIARKDYDDRRRRQMQGIAKAKMEGKYRGRPLFDPLQENRTAELAEFTGVQSEGFNRETSWHNYGSGWPWLFLTARAVS